MTNKSLNKGCLWFKCRIKDFGSCSKHGKMVYLNKPNKKADLSKVRLSKG